MQGRERLKRLFENKETDRVAFVPWVFSFAALLEQVTVQEMSSDAGLLSSSLLNAQELFGYDAISNVFDPTLEAEALGCEIDWGSDESSPTIVSHPLEDGQDIRSFESINLNGRGRFPAVLEATRRIKAVRGKDVALIGVVTGPVSLARALGGEAFDEHFRLGSPQAISTLSMTAGVALRVARLYCEAGVDSIAVADKELGATDRMATVGIDKGLKSIFNVVRYYGGHSFLLPGVDVTGANQYQDSLGADAIVIPIAIPNRGLSSLQTDRQIVGLGLEPGQSTQDDWLSLRNEIHTMGLTRLFVSTAWEVPGDIEVELMHSFSRLFAEPVSHG